MYVVTFGHLYYLHSGWIYSMANLKSLKQSITEMSESARIQLVILSRQRRIGFKSKPKKKANKKLINKLSQDEKQFILDQMKAMGL